MISFSNNRLVYLEDGEGSTVYSNTIGDLLLASSRSSVLQEISLCAKSPTSLSTGELAGTWHIISMSTPTDLSGAVSNHDVFFEGDADLFTGQITVTPSGTFTGLFSGSLNATAPGTVVVTTDEGPITFRVNASKDVLTATPADSDIQEFIVLVKKPDTLQTSELEGLWRVATLQRPSTLTEVFFNTVTETNRNADSAGAPQANELLVDLLHEENFEFEQGYFLVQSNGTTTGFANGAFRTNGDQTVSLNADGGTDLLHINKSKTLIIGSNSDPNSHAIFLLLKISDNSSLDFEDLVDLKAIASSEGLVLSWAGSTQLNSAFSNLLPSEVGVMSQIPMVPTSSWLTLLHKQRSSSASRRLLKRLRGSSRLLVQL